MVKIFAQYVSDFSRRSTRGYAYVNAVQQIQANSDLDTEQIKALLEHITTFAAEYSNSWPWRKGEIVSRSFLKLTNKIVEL